MDSDLELARRLQAEFEREEMGTRKTDVTTVDNSSLELARKLQAEYDGEAASSEMAPFLPPEYRTPQKNTKPLSCVSEEWETIDPTPDLHALFLEFNQTFFWGKLLMCEVKWSPRMTTCAGICRYSPRERFCTIGISIPLLKLRPRKDLVETLLHEMIHALLFITDNNDDHDGHGPEFHKHMYRINAATGANISVYHTFHDEVALYKQHWWRCNGPCTKRPPFYGFVKRAMNRAPGPTDRWWGQHNQNCGGDFVKVKEPEGFGKKKKKGDVVADKGNNSPDIRGYFGGKGKGKPEPVRKDLSANGLPKGLWDANEVRSKENGSKKGNVDSVGGGGLKKIIGGFSSTSGGPTVNGGGTSRAGGGPGVSGGGGRGNIFGFGGTSFSGAGGGGGLKTKGKTGTMVVKPGWKPPEDNSSRGSVVGGDLELPSSRFSGASDGAGFRLGSESSGGMSRGLSAREAARQRWATVGTSVVNTSNKTPSIPAAKKTQPIPASNKAPSKLTSIKATSTSLPTEIQTISFKPVNSVPCPICNKQMPEQDINTHLDTCLASQGNIDNVDNVIEDPFNDDDNDALLEATHDLEMSIHINSDDEPLVQTNIVLSDSDEEPLIKRPNKRKREKVSNDDELFGDLTAQDDQDILAALENSTENQNADESMFACPICDKLLSHNIMFNHLDTCLASM